MTGTIEADGFRAIGIETGALQSDPNKPSVGDRWIREDIKPNIENVTTNGVLRVQGPNGILQAPIIDNQHKSDLGENVFPGLTIVYNESTYFGTVKVVGGFVPFAGDGVVGSPRMAISGDVYRAHNWPAYQPVASRNDDNYSSNDPASAGLVIEPNVPLSSVGARVSKNTSDPNTAYLRAANGDVIKSKDISNLGAGEVFNFNDVDLMVDTEYKITVSAGIPGYNTSVYDYPFRSPRLDIVAGVGGADDGWVGCVNDVGQPASAIPDSAVFNLDVASLSLADGDNVSAWDDGIASNNVSQSTTSKQPVYSTDDNLSPLVIGDSSSNEELINSNPSGLPTGDSERTLIVIMESKSAASDECIFAYGDNASGAGQRFSLRQINTGNLSLEISGGEIVSNNVFAAAEKHLITVRVPSTATDVTDCTLRDNGTDLTIDSSSSKTLDTVLSYISTHSRNGSGYSNDGLKEALIYNTNLSGSGLDNEESRLADKHGITLN